MHDEASFAILAFVEHFPSRFSCLPVVHGRLMSTRCFIRDSSIEYLPLLLGYFKRCQFRNFCPNTPIPRAQVGGYLRLVHFMLFFWPLYFFSIKPHGCEWESFTRMQNAAIFTLLYPDYFSISYCLVFLTFNRCYGLFYHYYFFGVVWN